MLYWQNLQIIKCAGIIYRATKNQKYSNRTVTFRIALYSDNENLLLDIYNGIFCLVEP